MMTMFGYRTISLLALAAIVPACATPAKETCAPGEQRVVDERLYFGTGRAKGDVTREEWDDFLRVEVTKRFAQGFTVWQAYGQWRTADGAIVREATYVLNLVHPDDQTSETAVGDIRERYRTRFDQESTMRVRHAVCASF
ncbi:DUF3574 domain-containing protein [Caballeronia sp. NK8]|uniref:DUF3574 domain-containing protein n=1 Tax=Caballeronia sp. NK8 TaxID=140098 RepID=UPI001BB56EAB|nr:DUF3574 domain-containing protein [Caballeronia sp. NK8]BCQ25393.1 DUF3574 domain-containing protein [Caballeronia sp. NK8]